MPRVSVVIPTYNCAHYLGQAIQSVLAQTYTDLEVIVMDDGSRDNAEEVARQFGASVRYLRQHNQGLPAARNHAIEASTGEWIALLDADDWWEPTKLARQMALADRDPELALIYTDLRVIFDDGPVTPSFLASRPLAADGFVFDRLLESGFILPSTVLLRRSCLETVGMFDESMRLHEDIELWLRITHRWPVAGVREPLVNRRQGAQNMTSDARLRSEYGVKTYEKALGIPGLTDAERRRLKQKLADAHFELAYYLVGQGQGHRGRQSLRKSLASGSRLPKTAKLFVLSLLPRDVVQRVRRPAPLEQSS